MYACFALAISCYVVGMLVKLALWLLNIAMAFVIVSQAAQPAVREKLYYSNDGKVIGTGMELAN